MDERGLVERVDSLTAAVADLGFKLDTLISSTTAFRESFGERMTDYADLVAHWSIETEQNLQSQRRTVDRALAAQDEALARLLAAVEASSAAPDLLAEVRKLHDEPPGADALAAVLAEVAAVRNDISALARRAPDLSPVVEQVAAIRDDLATLPRQATDLAPVLAEVAALRQEVANGAPDLGAVVEQVAAIRDDLATLPRQAPDLGPVIEEVRKLQDEPAETDALAAVLAEVAAVRKDVAKLPRQATDVSPLLDELRQLREVLSEADVDDVEDEVSFAAALGEQLAALRSEVAALAAAPPAGAQGNRKTDAAVVEAIAGLRAELAALREQVATVPPVPPEVTALTDALQALRSELENEPADAVAAAPADDRLEETLAELVYEVRALRRRFPVRPSTGEADDEPVPAPRRRRRTGNSAAEATP